MNHFSLVRVVCCYKAISFCLITGCVFWKKEITIFATTLSFITFIVSFNLSEKDYEHGQSNIGNKQSH